MELTLKNFTTTITEEVVDIRLPFFFKIVSSRETSFDGHYGPTIYETKWGLIKENENEEVLLIEIEETSNDHDTEIIYEMSSRDFFKSDINKGILLSQCTEEDYRSATTKIIQSFINQIN